MQIMEVSTGHVYPAEVLPVENSDYKSLLKTRYFFDWKKEKKHEVFKLVVKGRNEILGLISIERIPAEWRIHIRLLSASKENAGSGKIYENVAANLIAHVAKIAIAEYGELACISLRPKSSIAQHYIEKYHMRITGMTLSLEIPEIIHFINKYDHD